MRTIIFVFLFSLLPITSAHAFSGNNLDKWCKNYGEKKALTGYDGVCVGLIEGFIKGLDFGLELGNKNKLYCLPEKRESLQIIKVIKKYMNEHPEELHYDFTNLIPMALLKAFPCKK